jgi:hypothetical protein
MVNPISDMRTAKSAEDNATHRDLPNEVVIFPNHE